MDQPQLTVLLQDDGETAAAGAKLGVRVVQHLPRERAFRIYLIGELGAGKTTFVRGFLRAIGIGGRIRSPTYTLIETYAAAEFTAVHVDLYRVSGSAEASSLGLSDYDHGGAIWLIEWADRAGNLPPADIQVELTYQDAGRLLAISASAAAKPVIEGL